MRRFVWMLSSVYATAGLVALFAAYLAQGKMSSAGHNPGIVLSLGLAVMAQVILALVCRLALFSGKSVPALNPPEGVPFAASLDAADTFLLSKGFTCISKDEKCSRYARRWDISLASGILAYLSLLVIMTLGCLNYGFSISGQIELSPGAEEIKLDSQRLDRGFLVAPQEHSYLLKVTELTPVQGKKPSQVTVVTRKQGDTAPTEHLLSPGDVFRLDRVKARYLHDYFVAFIQVHRKEHDYRATPLMLYPDQLKGYSGELEVGEPGVKGTGTFDPVDGSFTVIVNRDGKEEYRGRFRFAEKPEGGTYTVYVPAMLHAARFEVSRFSYRREILSGFFIFAGLVIVTLSLRGSLVEVCLEDGRLLGRGTSRGSLLRMIRGAERVSGG